MRLPGKASVYREELEEISPADFFYRNKALAGFDNPVKATYTIIRELVENALDACEEARRLPEVSIVLNKVEEKDKSIDIDSEVPTELYSLSVRDNGTGLSAEEIPRAFGQVLVSSKYKLMQSRGTFGLGGTMALLYGQITTNMPFEITSSTGSKIHKITMKIDIQANKPVVLREQTLGVSIEPFTEVKLHFRGNYPRARSKVIDYLRQTAMITPYANIEFREPDGSLYIFERNVRELPPLPKESLPHPKGIDLELLQRMLKGTKTRRLVSFLETEFQKVGRKTALEILRRANLDPALKPKELTSEQISALFRAITNYDRFLPPDPSILSPLGEKLFMAGIKKELKPEFVWAVKRPPSSVWGHPFLVETAIAYGGDINPTGKVQLYRFANRIPLLYDASSDVSYLVAKRINWDVYGIKSLEEEPIALFVHVVSTKIPFKTVGKEFMANEPVLAKEIELGWRECGRKLKAYLSGKNRVKRAISRYIAFKRYYEVIASSLEELTGKRPAVDELLRKLAPTVEEGGEARDESQEA
ncbi:MAG: DNA topoisomerase VI subunit B [Thermoproteota archaeon]|nr:MAG: DNA topoisomerase VI subunit B [Candidatus Korarchaeota archaeon]